MDALRYKQDGHCVRLCNLVASLCNVRACSIVDFPLACAESVTTAAEAQCRYGITPAYLHFCHHSSLRRWKCIEIVMPDMGAVH